MMIPPIMDIEMSMSMIESNKQDAAGAKQLDKEAAEFAQLGSLEREHMAAEFAGDQMLAGYMIGIYTARAILATLPKAVAAGVTF